MIEILGLILGGSAVSSFLTLLGTRYTARKQGRTDDARTVLDGRRVGIEEFETFKSAYEQRMDRLEYEISEQVTKTQKVTALLHMALTHIKGLHRDIQSGRDPRPLPTPLEEIIWTLPPDVV